MTLQNKYGNIEESARLKTLISSLGISQKRLAEQIGVSRTQINLIVNEERGLTENIVYRIERRYPNVNADWLIKGEGEMFKSDQIAEEPSPEHIDSEEEYLRKEVERLKEENARLATALLREQGLSDDLRELLKKLAGK